jgi:hypothetical protein
MPPQRTVCLVVFASRRFALSLADESPRASRTFHRRFDQDRQAHGCRCCQYVATNKLFGFACYQLQQPHAPSRSTVYDQGQLDTPCVWNLLRCGGRIGHPCWMRRLDGSKARQRRDGGRRSAYSPLCHSSPMDAARNWNFHTCSLPQRCSIAWHTQTPLLFDIECRAILSGIRFPDSWANRYSNGTNDRVSGCLDAMRNWIA